MELTRKRAARRVPTPPPAVPKVKMVPFGRLGAAMEEMRALGRRVYVAHVHWPDKTSPPRACYELQHD